MNVTWNTCANKPDGLLEEDDENVLRCDESLLRSDL